MTEGIDMAQIEAARTILANQAQAAVKTVHKLRIDQALTALRLLDTYPGRPPLPDAVLTEMVRDGGRDTWIAELLGIDRLTVRRYRNMLQLEASAPRGGSNRVSRAARSVWLDRWKPRLEQGGYLKATA